MMLIFAEPQAGSGFGFYAHNFQKKFWKAINKSLPVKGFSDFILQEAHVYSFAVNRFLKRLVSRLFG
jgi:hypothetical protein